MTEAQAFVVVVGGANVDVKARSSVRAVARTSNPGSARLSSGGVGRNIAENLARLGTTTHLVSAVGDDPLGDQLVRSTAEAGVGVEHVARLDRPTGSYTARAIEAVKSKLGAPYVYGAAGPSQFDCSGLMQWAYRQAGVSIPRTSQSQAGAGTNVGTNIANAKPGDLVIYYGDRHHVGMYVGGGQVIHAPHTGAVVRYVSATAMPISAIVRV